MKVAVVVAHPLKGSPGTTVRTRELILGLIRKGWKVTLYSPYQCEVSQWNGARVENIGRRGLSKGLSRLLYTITRRLFYDKLFVKTFYSSSSFRSKFSHGMAENLKIALLKDMPDIIQAVDNATVDWCTLVGKKLDIPTVVDLHNVTPEELVANHVIENNGPEFSRLQRINKRDFESLDGILAVSKDMEEYLIDRYDVPKERIVIVPHGGRIRANARFRIPWPAMIFPGLLTRRDHVDLFIESMPFVRKLIRNARFYITGMGEELRRLHSLAHKLGVNPKFFWIEKDSEFYKFLSSCNVGALTSRNDIPNCIGPPIKLWDFMSVGLPIVANYVGNWSDMIHKYKIGLVTKDSPKDFAENLVRLFSDEELTITCRRNQLRLIDGPLNWDRSVEEMSHFYDGIVG